MREGRPRDTFRAELRKQLGRDLDPEISLRDTSGAVDDAGAQRRRSGDSQLPSSSSSRILERLGSRGLADARYRIDGELARGGMGVILKVWDEDLRRELAMKVVLERGREGSARADEIEPEILSRFLEEAQITGQLDHPGIVPVHELGLDSSGHVYFTMRLVKGRDLADVFRQVARNEAGWTVTRALGVLLKACEAMAYAHEKGVIHRDLKPANVMVGRFGEVYVMDWGLARVLDDPEGHGSRSAVRSELREDTSAGALETIDGQVFGTPAYMSPEQARGETLLLTARTDVYAMGAMLYHLLSGAMPYRRSGEALSPFAILERLRSGPPAPLIELAPDAPSELIAIVEKAMARAPAARYEDIGELARDLAAYLEGRVVRAYRTGALAEFNKWVGRNRGTAAAIAAAILAVIGGLGSTSFVQARANDTLAQRNAELALARDEARNGERRASEAAERAAIEAATSGAVVDFLAGMFEGNAPDRARGRTITVKEVLDAAARSVGVDLAGTPEVRARLAATMGGVYRSLGLYDDAEPLLRDARGLWGSIAGPASAAAQEADLAWVELQIDRGRYDEAETALAAAFEAPEEARADPARARVLSARVLEDTGRWPAAIDELELALAEYERSGRGRSAAALRTKNTLIDLRGGAASFAELEQARQALVVEAETAFGADHPTTLALRLRLAEHYRHSADFARAEAVLDDVLAGRRRVLGPEHPDTLATADELAYLYFATGRSQAAIDLYERTLAAARDVLGPSHHDVLTAQNKHASALRDAGRVDEALALFEHTLASFVDDFGEQHPGTGATLNNLGLLQQFVGRYDEAEASLRRAMAIRREFYGERSYPALQTENNLALTYRSQGRHEEALPIAERVCEGYRAIFGDTHPETLTTLDNLGVTYYSLGRYDDAAETIAAAAQLANTALGDAHPLVGRMRNNLGAILIQLERWGEAVEQLEASYSSNAAVYGPEHPEAVKALGHLGKIHMRFGRYDEAEACYRKNYDGARNAFGDEHPATLGALGLLGSAYRLTERFEAAEAALERASSGLATVYEPAHPAVIDALFDLAEVRVRLGSFAAAREALGALEERLPAADSRRVRLAELAAQLE